MFDFINDRNLILVALLCIAGVLSILYGLYALFGLYGIVIPIGVLASLVLFYNTRY
jgi:hypothetical protein